MTRMKQVVLLRAVNVGGSNIIPMAKLINVSEQLGNKNNKTILQSGNLIFENAQTGREEEFESELSQRLHINIDVMIRSAATATEEIHSHGKDLYVTYPDGIGRSKLTTKVVEKYLGIPCTGRNWNTILKINTLLHTDSSTVASNSSTKASTKVPLTATEKITTSSGLKEVEKVSRKRSRG